MSFRINTNIAALNAHTNAVVNDRGLTSSLGKLSSGLRIQTAADDASGMSIADSLRSQASGLGQAINNANDAIGIVQTADKAMDEQIKILDTIKQKAIQAAQDGQNKESRRALQADINRLLEELDNIANTTSFNGQQLLNGTFSNKEFQIGAYSNETVKVHIGATESSKIGHTRFETTGNTIYSTYYVSTANQSMGDVTLKFSGIDGYPNGFSIQTISAAAFATGGLGLLAKKINESANETGIRASANNTQTMHTTIKAGKIQGLIINDVVIGNLELKDGDEDNVLIRAINDKQDSHGVTASLENGRLVLTSRDGRAIRITSNADFTTKNATSYAKLSLLGFSGAVTLGFSLMGQLSFVRQDARDIKVIFSSSNNQGKTTVYGLSKTTQVVSAGTSGANSTNKLFEQSVSLKTINDILIKTSIARAIGAYNPNVQSNAVGIEAGVTTYDGAQAVIDIAEAARKTLDRIRADLGSVQNQLTVTVNNISVTQVNVQAAESQIRDVDFAAESATFSKHNILAQSGAYAMTQANAVQQNVLRLLQ